MSEPVGGTDQPGREAFLDALATHGLLGSEEIEALRAGTTDGARGLAETLIARGRMTPFQAEVLQEERDFPLVFDRYTILEPAGQEGLDQLFLARHRSMDRIVLLRVYLPYEQDPEAEERFRGAAEIASRLGHRNVQAVYDAGKAQGRRYVALEWLDGEDLAGIVARRGTLPAAEAQAVVLQAAEGLRAAHAQGIGHGRLDAGRLHRLPDGTVKVTGLRVARDAQDALNPRPDIAALGRILSYLLTGEIEKPASNGGLSGQGQVPKMLSDVLVRLSSANPATRFATMAEVVTALQGIKETGAPAQDRPARPPRTWQTVGVAAALACCALVVALAVRPGLPTDQRSFRKRTTAATTGAEVPHPGGNRPPSTSRPASDAVRPMFGSGGVVRASAARARALAREEQWAEAIAALNEATAIEPDNLSLRRDRATYHIKLGQWTEAAADLSHVLRHETDHIEDWLARGRAYWEAGRWNDAIPDLATALEAVPTGQFQSVTEIVGAKVESSSTSPALAAVTQAIEREPARWALWWVRGLVRKSMNDLNGAVTDLETAVRHRPDRWDTWACLFGSWAESRHFARAQTFCEEVTRKNASSVWAFYYKGCVIFSEGQYDSSVVAFSQAIELNPADSTYWYMRSLSFSRLGRLDEALADASKAIELNPKDPTAWHARASYHASRDGWDAALADCREASRLGPDDVHYTHDQVVLLLKLGREAEARSLIAEAIARHGRTDDRVTANRIAWMGSLFPGAVDNPVVLTRLAERALAGNPQPGSTLGTLGTAQFRAGLYKEAIATLGREIAAQAGEGDVYDWLILAMAHHQLGQRDEANRWLTRAQTWLDDPNTTDIGPYPTARPLNWSRRTEIDRFRREAESLISGPQGHGSQSTKGVPTIDVD
jgi:tetratricopeptide (TPR) repeat protein